MLGVQFHFLNVGAGDCTIVHFPERTRGEQSLDERIMVIDICHDSESDYTNVIKYYKANFKKTDGSVKPIFRFVSTHPHQDHICGLNDFYNDSSIRISNFWNIKHDFVPEDFDGHRTHEDDWNCYNNFRKGKYCKSLNFNCNTDPGKYWDDTEDRIRIINPTDEDIKNAHYTEDGDKRSKIEIDEISYALLITINSRKILLSGDGHSEPVWDNIVNRYGSIIKNCCLLKAGHHGHKSSFHENAVKLINPEYVIFSNDKANDDDEGAEEEYKRAVPNCTIYKTYEDGNIVVDIPFSADKKISIFSNN